LGLRQCILENYSGDVNFSAPARTKIMCTYEAYVTELDDLYRNEKVEFNLDLGR